jgi:23S rRNA (cytosine1962-C5)-methyltransferase
MAREYARGRVLDGFTYNGGFGLAVAAQVDEVLAVDVSAEAVARVQRNAALNEVTNVTAREANVFDLLHDLDGRGERFDTVILDPPAFAKTKSAVEKARRGYKEINLRALKLLRPGGCLITCSCSYRARGDRRIRLTRHGRGRRSCGRKRARRNHPPLGVPDGHLVLRAAEAG